MQTCGALRNTDDRWPSARQPAYFTAAGKAEVPDILANGSHARFLRVHPSSAAYSLNGVASPSWLLTVSELFATSHQPSLATVAASVQAQPTVTESPKTLHHQPREGWQPRKQPNEFQSLQTRDPGLHQRVAQSQSHRGVYRGSSCGDCTAFLCKGGSLWVTKEGEQCSQPIIIWGIQIVRPRNTQVKKTSGDTLMASWGFCTEQRDVSRSLWSIIPGWWSCLLR